MTEAEFREKYTKTIELFEAGHDIKAVKRRTLMLKATIQHLRAPIRGVWARRVNRIITEVEKEELREKREYG